MINYILKVLSVFLLLILTMNSGRISKSLTRLADSGVTIMVDRSALGIDDD